MLRTNTGLPMDVAALAYKHLFMVEAIFRSMKSLLETRPIYHQRTRRFAAMFSARSWP